MDPFKTKLFGFKITLKGSWPRIWRRVHVPATYDFGAFSEIIIKSMGWWGSHNHGFEMKDPVKGGEVNMVPRFDPNHKDFENDIDERAARICDYFSASNPICIYTYDYGDDWQHEIQFERVIDRVRPKPRCVSGKGICPPENCGGIIGYKFMLKALKKPQDPEHDEMMEWTTQNGAQILAGAKFDAKSVQL